MEKTLSLNGAGSTLSAALALKTIADATGSQLKGEKMPRRVIPLTMDGSFISFSNSTDSEVRKEVFKRTLFTPHFEALFNGFTLSFEIRFNSGLSKVDPEQGIFTIQKNVSFSSLRLGLKKGRFSLILKNTKDREEIYFSEKELKVNQTYHVSIKCHYDYHSGLHQVCLLINGYQDLLTSVNFFNPFEHSQVVVGQYKSLPPFSGRLQKLLLFLYPLADQELLSMSQNYDLPSILSNSLYNESMQDYLRASTLPGNQFAQLGVGGKFFQRVEEEKRESTEIEMPPEPQPSELLQRLLDQEEYMFLRDKVIKTLEPGRYEYILRTCAILAHPMDPTFSGQVELNRLMLVLSYIHSPLSIEDVWLLAEVSTLGSIEDDPETQTKQKYLWFQAFIRALRKAVPEITMLFTNSARGGPHSARDAAAEAVFNDLDSECSDEVDDDVVAAERAEEARLRAIQVAKKCTAFEEVETDSFDGVENGYEEVTVVGETLEQQVKAAAESEEGIIGNEDEEEERQVVGEITIPDDWNEGEIEVGINRCSDCAAHFHYSRHSEDEYVQQFNDVGEFVLALFPHASIVGNYEKPSLLGEFEVYVRGLGFQSQRDTQNRYFIFRKSLRGGRFPTKIDILDHLICLSTLYGDSRKMAIEQKLRNEQMSIPKPSKFAHGYPCEMPDNIIKQPLLERNQRHDNVEMKCSNWGCDGEYMADRNDKMVCKHHPGRFEFGSEQGLWPEGWTCCRAEWESPGCALGIHRGYPKHAQLKFCLNHGEPNPKSIYPDSYCGKPFEVDAQGKQIDDESNCKYHSGYFIVKNRKTGDGIWSCCQSEDKEGGCIESASHRFVEYPDEEAKKYFFDRHVRPHPSDGWRKDKNQKSEFELFGRFCGYFRSPVPYKPKNPGKPRHTMSADEEKKMNLKDKVCLNWACNKIFKNITNHKKACKCHPGRWDFGYSSKNVSEGVSGVDQDEQLWSPHWTCCRGNWESEGCQRTFHRGEFLDQYSQNPRKYQWPDWRVQTYFKKTVSHLWQKKLDQQYSYDEETLFKKFRKVALDEGSGGRLRVDDLPALCDKLGLHLLMHSEDMSYHFKYVDVVNGTASAYLDDGQGNIDYPKFQKWWYMSVEEIMAKDEKPPLVEAQPPNGQVVNTAGSAVKK